MRTAVLPALLTLAACTSAGPIAGTGSGGQPDPSANAKATILANKNRLWKDPDSIKSASIAAPTRDSMGRPWWQVCLRLNAKNSFGAYTGEKPMVVMIYDSGEPPSMYEETVGLAGLTCSGKQYTPFPELNGDYRETTPGRG